MAGSAHLFGISLAVASIIFTMDAMSQETWQVTSPGGQVTIALTLADLADIGREAGYPAGKARLYYKVALGQAAVLPWSPLGIARRDQDFVDGLVFERASPAAIVDTTYSMPHGKRRICRDHCREQVLTFKNPGGGRLEIHLRAYDDGAAFRYRFPEENPEPRMVLNEITGFRLPSSARVWMHPYDRATEYSPAYETYYEDGAPAGKPAPYPSGWAFPVLFQTAEGGPWGLITEAGLDDSYCGSRLEGEAPQGVYRIRFPEEGEGNFTGATEPSSRLPWATPWRAVMASSSPGGIVESTLISNLSPPSILKDASWVKPGRASWSWLSDHDSPQDCVKLKKFVDLSAEMGWEYTLVDANWTVMKNGTIHDLIGYAKEKGVGVLLWYNSGGCHNYVSEKPHGLMWHEKIRRKELKLLSDWGVKGVKVDFFQSDKQNIVQLYLDILKDAADFKILVNFHGCTLPRGWSRTYPHLLGMEAVRGAECYSFDKLFTEKAPVHNTIVPFTRNAVGPMDYTPVMLEDNVYPHVTTYAHELALPLIFESGLLHFADRPEAYARLPEASKAYLKRVPVAWDETRCIGGEPGKHVEIACRHGDDWYVGGINGLGSPREVRLDLSFLSPGSFAATIIEDGGGPRSLAERKETVKAGGSLAMKMIPRGGFVIELSPAK